MLPLLAAFAIGHQTSPDLYKPNGPVIQVLMSNGRSFEITTDPKTSPKTVAHILDLVKKRFYDGQRVHRVEWWVTQWGAPASKSEPMDIPVKQPDGTTKMDLNPKVGDGGSGHNIPVFEEAPNVDFYRGIVGVASEGLQLPGDSQLFILRQDWFRLYRAYAVVGKVTKGMDIVGTIQRGDRIRRMSVLADNR